MSSDSFAVKVAVCVLAFIAVSGSICIQALALLERGIPEEVVVSAGAAVTGILGLLAATRTGPAPVEVVNAPADPVPVEVPEEG